MGLLDIKRTITTKILATVLVLWLGTADVETYFPADVPPQTLEVDGYKGFILTSPKGPSVNRPWVWFAPVLRSEPGQPPNSDIEWTFSKLLDNGISIAGIDVGESYGSPHGTGIYDKFYTKLTSRKWSRKVCLLAQSRGGLMLFRWALANPQSVCCIAGIYPVIDMETWPNKNTDHTLFLAEAREYGFSRATEFGKHISEFNPINHLQVLADSHIRMFNIHGDQDTTVSYQLNSRKLTDQYNELGGEAHLVTAKGAGHIRYDARTGRGAEFFRSDELVNFLVKNCTGK